jgi:hypothetical protein
MFSNVQGRNETMSAGKKMTWAEWVEAPVPPTLINEPIEPEPKPETETATARAMRRWFKQSEQSDE